jgi:hypothetical protein
MPEGSQPGLNWTTDQGMFHVHVWAIRMWSPLLSKAFRWNAQAYEGFGTITGAWQTFVEVDFEKISRSCGGLCIVVLQTGVFIARLCGRKAGLRKQ